MVLEQDLIEQQRRHIPGILCADGKTREHLRAQFFDFSFGEGWLSQRLR
jgi:hypothetical protein